MTNLTTIIMAGGKGTRMKSARPKVLQHLAGKPLLEYVLDIAQAINSQKNIVIYGFEGEQVKNAFPDEKWHIDWVHQAEQLGTGHAVMMTLDTLPKAGKSLILSGDVPLIQPQTLEKLLAINTNGMAILTLEMNNPFGLGRIVRENGKVVAIVEEKDATPEQKQIREINSGVYAVDNTLLHKYLPKLTNDNAQGEYYLTDIVKMAIADKVTVATVSPQFAFEIEGINDRKQLASLERTWQAYQVEQLQVQGVQFADPSRVDIRGQLTCGKDVFVDINVIFEGEVTLGDNVTIGAGCIVKNSHIASNTTVQPYSLFDNATVGENNHIGPFARLRPNAVTAADVHIGNFVELKNTQMATGAKANHLAYLGDAQIGQKTNIGAGTITCNYDGVNKFKTVIGDNAFIGSNSSLVAPVMIGNGATIGAGSVITKTAPDDKLTLTRAKQTTVDSWRRPHKK